MILRPWFLPRRLVCLLAVWIHVRSAPTNLSNDWMESWMTTTVTEGSMYFGHQTCLIQCPTSTATDLNLVWIVGGWPWYSSPNPTEVLMKNKGFYFIIS